MADPFIAHSIIMLALFIINLLFLIKISLSVSAHLQKGQNFSNIVMARRLANRGLAFGVIACFVWAFVSWQFAVNTSAPNVMKAIVVACVYFLICTNLLITLRCEERISLTR